MAEQTAVAELQEGQLIQVLAQSLYPGASVPNIKMVLEYCRAAKLDPMQKPVHIVPMWDRNLGGMRDVIMPGIGLYRIQAARSGRLAGISEPEFGPEIESEIGGQVCRYPEWCKVIVRRELPSGTIAEFTAIEYWLENYAVKGGKEKSIAPNAMWTKRPRGQLAKCAQAQALRMAFPEIGAAPTAEEMEGKTIDAGNEPLPEPIHAIPAELEAAAKLGVEAFRAAWKCCPTRKHVSASQLQSLKVIAEAADASKTQTSAEEATAEASE